MKIRTVSEIVRGDYRRHVAELARWELDLAVEALRSEASRTRAGKLSMRDLDDEIAAARRDRRRNVDAAK